MAVSFTGINNLRVGRKTSQNLVMYADSGKNLKQGVADITEIKLKFNLANDAQGNDFDMLYKAVTDSKRYFVYNTKSPNDIEIHLMRAKIKDDVVPVTKNILKLNGQNINITKRADLRLYTHLAKLTKGIGYLDTTSPEQKKCIRLVNKAIGEEAIDYIDNVM